MDSAGSDPGPSPLRCQGHRVHQKEEQLVFVQQEMAEVSRLGQRIGIMSLIPVDF